MQNLSVQQLCEKINLPEQESLAAQQYIQSNCDSVNLCANKMRKGKLNCLKKLSPVARLASTLVAATKAYDDYLSLGICDDVFFDTMSDIRVWCENDRQRYSRTGLENIWWLSKHVRLKIFKIGRLQFEFSRFYFLPTTTLSQFAKCPYRLGEKCLTVHIPQGAPLLFEQCKESIKNAKAFFAKYFPDFSFRAITTHTWLLNPDFAKVLSDKSNIVKFASLFTVCGYSRDTDMNARRVFGYGTAREDYVPFNALSLYTLERLNKGKPLYSYLGYLK